MSLPSSLVDLGYVHPGINVCAVAFDDDGASFRRRKLTGPCFCCVVIIELASFYNDLARLGELVPPECSLGRFCIGHAFDNTD